MLLQELKQKDLENQHTMLVVVWLCVGVPNSVRNAIRNPHFWY